ncbi:AraC family transcriptional regulator [Streptomyces kasugaensis]|uniref:AraC family transcriptional regulator n=1 Tax=Streptomyces kasugaensis TaxID=1946 RepID=A0A4Q9HRR8_STRKA|nr:helix-turn-helix domain-containing protein [Streptomyces kasugaensis]TBO57662.1 AraC family transcriptional regulator [Streptomyces kasugaensis]
MTRDSAPRVRGGDDAAAGAGPAGGLRVYGVSAAVDGRGTGRRDGPGAGHGGTVPGSPDVRLRDYVHGYVGFGPTMGLPAVQRVLPEVAVMLVLDFVARPSRLVTAEGGAARMPSLPVIGLHDRPVLVEHGGSPRGVAIGLTPPGAHALFGVAMSELANTYTSLADLVGGRAWCLVEQLSQLSHWQARFALLDRTLTQWLAGTNAPAATVLRAWRRLTESAGQLTIAGLSDELGCSRRYLEMRFGEQVGLPPKTAARILRFKGAARILTAADGGSLSEIAGRCGYSDQAHLNRDFRALAGCTPTEFLLRRSSG